MTFDPRTRRFGAAALGITALGAAAATLNADPVIAAGMITAVTTVSCSVTGANWCISGNNSSSGIGVIGTSKTGTGLRGTSTSQFGLKATSVSGSAILAQTTSGPTAITANASNSGGTGLYGTGSIGAAGTGSTYGVYGVSQSGTGVYGTGDIGVHGNATAGGTGVMGNSNGGPAIEGVGSGSATALYGSAGNGYGLIAESAGRTAIYGSNSNGNGGDVSGSYIGIVGRSPTSGFPLVLTDSSSHNLFYVDGSGNVRYHGSLQSFTRTASGATVSSFSARTTTPTVEDTGTAQLIGGAATVRLDPSFRASVDSRTPYRVFLTPGGDTHGLFVATKAAGGFIVRETEGGHSTLSFDYRIVATALGQSSEHMAEVNGATGNAIEPRALLTLPPKQHPAVTPAAAQNVTPGGRPDGSQP